MQYLYIIYGNFYILVTFYKGDNMRNPLDILLRAGEKKILKSLELISKEVNSKEQFFESMSDFELRDMTQKFKDRLNKGESLDDILVEAFAVVREAAKRTLGQRHYDVQIMGGAALHKGNIAEMKTGEGKTLVSTLPAYLNALNGKGVHVVTTNDYLAKRDSEWMGRIHRFLGLTVGVILSDMDPSERKNNYNMDITYGTNNEFGFDYLRDNMATEIDDCVQRGHFYAIIDEVDSILIDEARTPLIISGPADKPTVYYSDFAKIVSNLSINLDYEVDLKKQTVGILEPGINKIERALNIDNLYDTENTHFIIYLNNALKAKELFKRDKDYILVNGELLIVDEHTGRVLSGRRYSEGLHQALEAKENVKIKDENQTLATITLQNYFRLYEKLGGMTGTAQTEASEFYQIYKLGVVPIPTNKPMIRLDREDLFYKSEEAKFKALANDIEVRHKKGQPILVGTVSVEKSEMLSKVLVKRGIPHEVLNAKQHEREAYIIANAGKLGAVTVSTNMAGRGTDIMLGGNAEFMTDYELHKRGLDPVNDSEAYEEAWDHELKLQKELVKEAHDKVVALGGLYVLGTERHESRRIDNQLRGRSGRQGDPGESRFYLSLQDELMERFNSGVVSRFLSAANFPEDQPIEAKMISNAIKSAQTQIESLNFEMRKNILKYDDVMNSQRSVIYAERKKILFNTYNKDEAFEFLLDTVRAYLHEVTSNGYPEEWDLAKFKNVLNTVYPSTVDFDDLIKKYNGKESLSYEILENEILLDIRNCYNQRLVNLGKEVINNYERALLLIALDQKWRNHLYEMDYLKEGIGLRAMAQRDPLVEYQKEGFVLFNAMKDEIKEDVAHKLFKLQSVIIEKNEDKFKKLNLNKSNNSNGGNNSRVTVSRNSQCPCGSGKKYKRCHGNNLVNV
jgi:preprotein translocase subunit SecA